MTVSHLTVMTLECASLSMTSSPAVAKDTIREPNALCRSISSKDLCRRTRMRRSYSDNHIHASAARPKLRNSRSIGIFNFQFSSSIIPNSLPSFLVDPEMSKEMKTNESKEMDVRLENSLEGRKRANWIERLLEIRSQYWRERQQKHSIDDDREPDQDCGEDRDEGGCEVDYDDEEDESKMSIDCESFSRLLVRVSRPDAKVFSRLAALCNKAYAIPQIKAMDLRRSHSLILVTSSLEKKAKAAILKEKFDQDSTTCAPVASSDATNELDHKKAAESEEKHMNPAAAYEIAASAACFVHSRAKDPLSEESSTPRVYESEVAAQVAESTITVVVAAGEKEKQKAAKDLQSLHSSPCEWFVCDDPSTYTRCFIIQGSDSLSSWQANLFFEPTKFEGTEVLVHRGIYEAAKGIYEQFMPEIMEHMNRHGERAKLQFAGHSLGGSLSLLVSLMLLTREVVKPSALRPVVTFGSPYVFCGGEKILDELGLDEDHVHCVMMHRDIVPRAFACNYPDRFAQLLKRLTAKFRSHPCLNRKKLLYSPMGKLFILQPDEDSSPPHPMLPPGSAFYMLENSRCRFAKSAIRAFLNAPHPLKTLSHPTAYGSEGTIRRDHDSKNYLKAVTSVLRQCPNGIAVRKPTQERSYLLPILTSQSPHAWSHKHNLEDPRLEVVTGA
ncbi:phospholipase A1 PLIP1, chloroplastic [Diospyros lotus]|uniref:phospholipase A1 PLIP1, chloroplastic n=1 Tax=Diospyros lotus TaxID=55363 RepID=UPI002258A517|nr:phospholipase A1 PLIP1, chloroplastic [Diospyros lotus]